MRGARAGVYDICHVCLKATNLWALGLYILLMEYLWILHLNTNYTILQKLFVAKAHRTAVNWMLLQQPAARSCPKFAWIL